MINARIAGTALHLNIDDNRASGQISYKKYRIWGIKTIIRSFVRDIFDIIYEHLPENELDLSPNDLLKPLHILAERYSISYENILSFIEERKKPKKIWEPLDTDLKAIFYVNSFFEAFEKNLIDEYYIALKFFNPKIQPQLKPADFWLKDFGFVFRARGYSRIFSKNVYNNGFANTITRLNKILYLEYRETFIDNTTQNSSEGDILDIEALPKEKRFALEMLRNGNSHEKLEAINIILENKIIEAVNELEFLLNYEDEKVMNRAFDTILVLKNLD